MSPIVRAARFPRSHLTSKSFVKTLMCSYERAGWLGYRDLGFSKWGPLHMSPVDRAGSVTEMKLVSVHMVTFSSLSGMKNLSKW